MSNQLMYANAIVGMIGQVPLISKSEMAQFPLSVLEEAYKLLAQAEGRTAAAKEMLYQASMVKP